MTLPVELSDGLEQLLGSASSGTLAAVARELSARYREGGTDSGHPLVRSRDEAAAYAAYRLPATYAAVAAVLEEAKARQPGFKPRTILDVGAGPGTALWAAVTAWPDLRGATALEPERHMLTLGRDLAASAGHPAIRNATWVTVEGAGAEPIRADLVVAAYVIGEVPPAKLGRFLRFLWESTAVTCAIVEPGTPRGFRRIQDAGDFLTAKGAHLTAPYPHGWTCVEGEGDWCHFSARVPRTRLHRALKGGTLGHEDEKFSYLVASRLPGRPIAGRVVRHPQVRSGLVQLAICTESGVKRVTVTRRQGEAYRRARDLRWGSAIETDDGPLFGL